MEPPAPLRVTVDASDRVAAVVAAALPGHARRRGLVLAVHGRGPAPPWRPADATLTGIVDGCLAAAVPSRWTALGRPPHALGALVKLASPGSDRRSIALHFDDGTLSALPRAWIGRHALVVAPTLVDPPSREPGESACGPLVASLAALAAAAGARGVLGHAEFGARLLAQVFAGFTWVLDADRALVRPRRPGTRPLAAGLRRVFVHGGLGLDAHEVLARAQVIDAWLHARGAPLGAAAAVEPVGRHAAEPWPAAATEPVGVDGPVWSTRPRARAREVRST